MSSTHPLSSHSVSLLSGVASATPRLLLHQRATFGAGVGSTAIPKGQVQDPQKIADLKSKYQNFYDKVSELLGIEGVVESFYLNPDHTEMKGFLRVRTTFLDPSNPEASPKEMVQLFNLPLLALQLTDTQFQELNGLYQDICRAQIGREVPDGLKKSFNQQLNTQSLEARPFNGAEMLKGPVRAFLSVQTAEELDKFLKLNKTPGEIQKIEKQLDLAKTSGLVQRGHEPAVLLALFDLDPAHLRKIFQEKEPEETHWYSRLGFGKDTAKQNREMAFKMIDKIIAECQAFSLNPEVQQEASRFFAQRQNLNIGKQQYNPPKVGDLDILFSGEKKEWKTHQKWLDHFNRFALNDQEKLDLLKSFNTWRGEEYREKLAQEDNPYQKDLHFLKEDATDSELESFLQGLDFPDGTKDNLKTALKASLKEGRTLKDLTLPELVEKLGSPELNERYKEAAERARVEAAKGQSRQASARAPASQAQSFANASRPLVRHEDPSAGNSPPIQGRIGGGVRGEQQNSGSGRVSGQRSASGGGSAQQRRDESQPEPSSRRGSADSAAGVHGESSSQSFSSVSSRSASSVSRSGASSAPGSSLSSSQAASRSASPGPSRGDEASRAEEMQSQLNWIQDLYHTLHTGEELDKQELTPLYGFGIDSRSFLEDKFLQKRQLEPTLKPEDFVKEFQQPLNWAKSMLDQHLETWIKSKDSTFTTDQVNVLKSSPRVLPLLDALAQAYDPRVTRDQEQKLRTFAVLDKAKWDSNTLKEHREDIQSTLDKWNAFNFDDSIDEAAQGLKTDFLSTRHTNLDQDLQEFNGRILTNRPTPLAIQYEKETKFSGSPSFNDWLQKPENLYDQNIEGRVFKDIFQKPDVKRIFLDRENPEAVNLEQIEADFSTKVDTGDIPLKKKLFEEFVLSKKNIDDWTSEKNDQFIEKLTNSFIAEQQVPIQEVLEDTKCREVLQARIRKVYEDDLGGVLDGVTGEKKQQAATEFSRIMSSLCGFRSFLQAELSLRDKLNQSRDYLITTYGDEDE